MNEIQASRPRSDVGFYIKPLESDSLAVSLLCKGNGVELIVLPLESNLQEVKTNKSWQKVIPQPTSRISSPSLPSMTFDRDTKIFGPYSTNSKSLLKILTRDFGLKPGLAGVISGRTSKRIVQIFRQWDSVMDGFILGYPEIFQIAQGAVRKVFRSFLGQASCSIDMTTEFYKDFVSLVKDSMYAGYWLTYRTLVTGNYFSLLYKYLTLLDLSKKETYTRLCHIISTRHLAPGGDRATLKAIAKFKENIQKKKVEPPYLDKLEKSLEHVLGICSNGFVERSALGEHISISGSADYYVTQQYGGKATAMLADANRILNKVPDYTYLESGPWGQVLIRKGIPIWQCFDIDSFKEGEIEKPRWLQPEEITIVDRPPPLRGAGKYTGNMVLYAAYHKYLELLEEKRPIETRMETVSEPGGKARCITVAEWWLPTISSGPVHVWSDFLSRHPSAYTVFKRQDQAWSSLKMLGMIKHKFIQDGFSFLCSDFESATDNVPFWLSKMVIKGLLKVSPYFKGRYDYLTDLVGPRRVRLPTSEIIESSTAIFMGEPLSKVVLVASLLMIEEYCFSLYSSIPFRREWTIKSDWRAFHVGGDDHLVYGPLEYLELIAQTSEDCGYVFSKSKHRISSQCAMYTEKVLFLKNRINMNMREINSDVENSIWVDSIKVRLISPHTKVLDARDDRNIAIGKAKSLARTFEYFPKGTILEKIARSSLQRFLVRFAAFVPSPSHRTITAIMRLPESLGGLGLCVYPDDSTFEHLPDIYWWAINHIKNMGDKSYKIRKILQSTFQNRSNFKEIKYLRDFTDQMESYPSMVGKKLSELYDMFPEHKEEPALFIDFLHEEGYVSFTEFFQLLDRPYRFIKMLQNPLEKKHFNTTPNSKRVWRAWAELEKVCSENEDKFLIEKSYAVIRKAASLARFDWFVNLKEVSTVATIPVALSENLTDDKYFEYMETGIVNFRDTKFEEHILYNAPDFVIRPKVISRRDDFD